jgi:hypothetical protein
MWGSLLGTMRMGWMLCLRLGDVGENGEVMKWWGMRNRISVVNAYEVFLYRFSKRLLIHCCRFVRGK